MLTYALGLGAMLVALYVGYLQVFSDSRHRGAKAVMRVLLLCVGVATVVTFGLWIRERVDRDDEKRSEGKATSARQPVGTGDTGSGGTHFGGLTLSPAPAEDSSVAHNGSIRVASVYELGLPGCLSSELQVEVRAAKDATSVQFNAFLDDQTPAEARARVATNKADQYVKRGGSSLIEVPLVDGAAKITFSSSGPLGLDCADRVRLAFDSVRMKGVP